MNRNEFDRQFVDTILERGLGYPKRKYDMSDLYASNQISTVVYTPYSENQHPLKATFTDAFEDKVTLELTGVLTYSTASVSNESVNSYRYIKESKDGSMTEDYPLIFSNIDINLLDTNTNYRNAVFNELLSKNNLRLSNAGGYIGEIVTLSNPLPVGTERQDDKAFYKYQISENYALEFDSQDLSAAVNYTRQQATGEQSSDSRKTLSNHDDEFEL